MGLGFEIGKDLGSTFVIIMTGFVIKGLWTSNKPLTTFDKVFVTIGLFGFIAFLPAGLSMIFPTQMRDYYESKHQDRHIEMYGFMDEKLLERQRLRKEQERLGELFR
tara:strand:+ start:862 stop:1182 length:321 start_codon:yes stop_codon:yes gene_type:complete